MIDAAISGTCGSSSWLNRTEICSILPCDVADVGHARASVRPMLWISTSLLACVMGKLLREFDYDMLSGHEAHYPAVAAITGDVRGSFTRKMVPESDVRSIVTDPS